MKNDLFTKRQFIKKGLKALSLSAFLGISYKISKNADADNYVWQIDPYKCVQCERCASNCVLSVSAVKCVHSFKMCGYCKLCYGYFNPGFHKMDTGAENQLCPTGAIVRKYVEEPFYEYSIDKNLCIGCAKCVKACGMFGNRSLYLQVSHDVCINCNECGIAKECPSDAFIRVPAKQGYIIKDLINSTG